MKTRVVRRSYRRAGKVVPLQAKHFKGRSVKLAPGQAMDWHSTRNREEVLIALAGTIHLETENGSRAVKATRLFAGQCAFLPTRTRHQVTNRSRRVAHYLYLTA